MKIWTVTTDDNESVVTTVFTDDQAAWNAIKANYASDAPDDFDVTDIDGRAQLSIWLLTTGVEIYVDEHEIQCVS